MEDETVDPEYCQEFQIKHQHKFHDNHPKVSKKLASRFRKPKNIRKARHLPTEDDTGRIEYKTKVCQFSDEQRMNRLITQMKFRLFEGDGVAIYNLGYFDDGRPDGMSQPILLESLNNFFEIAQEAQAEVRSMNILKGKNGYCVNIYLISKIPPNNQEDYFPNF